ncbi:MAG: hypothetical protein Q4C69_09225 [Lachnoclostridium edouardi]|nr:hypothetical protein [Lachnoclostridium edouardi]
MKLLQLNASLKKDMEQPEKPHFSVPVDELLERLKPYDIISFDVFDTLIFRRLSRPTDVFIYMEAKYHFYNFSEIRIKAEKKAREKSRGEEITISDIYKILEVECSIDSQEWIEKEIECEKEVCFANPYMLKVFQELTKMGKKMIAVSDMYLSRKTIEEILRNSGYEGFDKIFVSCEEKAGKWDEKIFGIVNSCYQGKKILHIGDNMNSDVSLPKKAGWEAIYYPNVASIKKRPGLGEMSVLTKSVYEAILNTYLYNGLNQYDQYFKFGFENGGIIAVGYCQWLKKIAEENHIDKLLFVARDGYILKKVYDEYFAGIPTEYVLFSRFNAQQVMFDRYTSSYIDQTILPRAYKKDKMSIGQALREIDLDLLIPKLEEAGIKEDELLVPDRMDKVASFIYQHRDVISVYFSQTQNATFDYYKPIVEGCKKVLVVDLGWNGTCGIALKYLLEEKKKLDITVCSALVGAKDGQEPTVRMTNGDLFVYGFARNMNYDLQKNHMGKDVDYHNLLMEILFTAPEPSFLKFGYTPETQGDVQTLYKSAEDPKAILNIHHGISEFSKCWHFILFNGNFRSFTVLGREVLIPFQNQWQQTNLCKNILNSYQ